MLGFLHEKAHFLFQLQAGTFCAVAFQLGVGRNPVGGSLGKGAVFQLGKRGKMRSRIAKQRRFLKISVAVLAHLARCHVAVKRALADFEPGVAQERAGIKLRLENLHGRRASLDAPGFFFHRGPCPPKSGNVVRGGVLLHAGLTLFLCLEQKGEIIGLALFHQVQQVDIFSHGQPR